MVTSEIKIPVVINGGAGKWKDFVDGIENGGASAVGTSNIYHFTESSIISAKRFMYNNNFISCFSLSIFFLDLL